MKKEAKAKTIRQTFDKLKTIPGCSKPVPDDDCYSVVLMISNKSKLVLDYRNNMLTNSGGPTGLTNQ